MAALLTFGGIIQLIPAIRKYCPQIHRWNGRGYIAMAIASSLAGLYLLLTRDAFGGIMATWGLGVNGLLIMVFGAVTWAYARNKNYAMHRVWALRLFLAVSGVWFFRIGLMLWLFIFRAPVGFDPETFTGPFLTFLSFGGYLLPLALLELYLYAARQENHIVKAGVAAALFFGTVSMSFGILAATLGLWWPRIGV